MIESMEQTIAQEIQSRNHELRSLSIQIHDNPELSFNEHFAHQLLTDYLEKQGFIVTRKACGLDTEYGTPGFPVVGFLSEYDALPKIGHACGHNLIAIVGVGSAMVFKAVIVQFYGNQVMDKHGLKAHLKLFGTPGEERDGGKIHMINTGAFKDVDIALMAHPGNLNCVYAHYLALEMITLEYFGRSSHASAAPWDGINALDAVSIAYQSVSVLRQQMKPTNRIHGIIRKGGEAPNIIPDYTNAEFFVRGAKISELMQLIPRVKSCFEAGAHASGCTMKITESPLFYDVKYNEKLCEVYVKHMEKLGAKFPSRAIQESTSRGSTDMGNVTYAVPGFHPVFDIGVAADIHTDVFRDAASSVKAHDNALRAIEGLVLTAVECISDPTLMQAIKQEFKDSNV